jgi:hypothetical protein
LRFIFTISSSIVFCSIKFDPHYFYCYFFCKFSKLIFFFTISSLKNKFVWNSASWFKSGSRFHGLTLIFFFIFKFIYFNFTIHHLMYWKLIFMFFSPFPYKWSFSFYFFFYEVISILYPLSRSLSLNVV